MIVQTDESSSAAWKWPVTVQKRCQQAGRSRRAVHVCTKFWAVATPISSQTVGHISKLIYSESWLALTLCYNAEWVNDVAKCGENRPLGSYRSYHVLVTKHPALRELSEYLSTQIFPAMGQSRLNFPLRCRRLPVHVYEIWSGSVNVCRSYSRKINISYAQSHAEARWLSVYKIRFEGTWIPISHSVVLSIYLSLTPQLPFFHGVKFDQ